MTENGLHYIAEQAWTCCSPEVASRLLEVDSPTWLLPFLRLAGGDGEQAGGRLLSAAPHAPGRDAGRTLLEEVELGDGASRDAAGATRRTFAWRTAGFQALFRRLEGEISSAGRGGGTVIGIEGRFEGPQGLEAMPNGPLAARRAAEVAARSLLGHLRSALEEPSLEEMLA